MGDDAEKGLRGRLKALLKRRAIGNSADLAEGLHDLMDEGQARGFITDEETHMVYGVLDLKQTRAHSVMIPRTEISAAPLDATLGEIIDLVKQCGHTRIPIHANNIDQIVGILHAKDLLKLWGRDSTTRLPDDILRKPYFVPESQRISELLAAMRANKMHLAIVTDEYGGTSGIITIEDILEEIVGDIVDEHDQEEPRLTVVDQETLLVDARLKIEKLMDHLQMELPNGDFESVGGLLIHLRGAIPQVDEKIVFKDLEFTVQEADQRRIDKVLVRRRKPPEPPQENAPEA